MMTLLYAWGLSPVVFLLLAFLLTLCAVRTWTTRGRSRSVVVLAALALIAAVPAYQGIPLALSNAGLKNLPVGSGVIPVLRLGINTPGDVAAEWFVPSSGTCSQHSGAGDVGSCNSSADGKSWLGIFPNGVYDPAEFGATGQGSTTDDTSAIQDAINAMQVANGKLSFQGKTYCIKTGPLEVGGNGRTVSGAGSLATTLSACGADVSILQVGNTSPSSDGYFHDMFIAGSQTLGTTHPAIISTYCGHCSWQNLRVIGGSNSMNVTANNYNAVFLGGFYFRLLQHDREFRYSR